MRLEELKSKWKLPEVKDWTVVSDSTAVVKIAENSARFGDFLAEYMEHKAIPWWKRMSWSAEWDVVEKRMRQILNEETLVWCERNK